MFTLAIVQSALELGFIYALVAMALFLSFRVLNIAVMTPDGAFALGTPVPAAAAVPGPLQRSALCAAGLVFSTGAGY